MTANGEAQGQGGPASRNGSLAAFAGAMLVLTCVSAGSGFLVGMQLAGVQAPRHAEEKAHLPEKKSTAQTPDENANLVTLTPIIANLAEPSTAWVRIEASVISDAAISSDVRIEATKISEDIVTLMKTMSLSEIEGPRGFQNLREDLNDRVRIRSDGRFRDLIIHGFVVE